nr:TnsA endonuclease C-terminal domain-containing protein [Pyrinomonadaceae bacterium]
FEKWEKLKPKFKIARQFAKSKGWRFCIFTEHEIRGVLLNNLKFLSKFANYFEEENELNIILMQAKNLPQLTPRNLLDSINLDKMEQAKLLPALWHLIATNVIKADLNVEINMRSKLSV